MTVTTTKKPIVASHNLPAQPQRPTSTAVAVPFKPASSASSITAPTSVITSLYIITSKKKKYLNIIQYVFPLKFALKIIISANKSVSFVEFTIQALYQR